MKRTNPLSLATALVIVLASSLFFGIPGIAQSPQPNDKELEVTAFPAGVTLKYVSPNGQVSDADCYIGENDGWYCNLPGVGFVVRPPDALVEIWNVVQTKSDQPISQAGLVPFVGFWRTATSETLPTICIISRVAQDSDPWSFRCVLGNYGTFRAVFDTGGFIPKVIDPVPKVPPIIW